ncbi:MAG: DUF1592 domain-containing protein [Verrucomicrobiales bacterium]|nr:DUF1592 domain-containing protein [Verrucomicrobiales bacterium]
MKAGTLAAVAIGSAVVIGAGLFLLTRTTPESHYETEIEPILMAYCYDCHGDGMDKGEIALDDYDSVQHLFSDVPTWEGVYKNVEGFLMPPAEKKQPTDEERRKLIAWIERDVFKLDPENPDPGRVTIRRLNRDEYNNTMRDLVGMDLRPADEFPEDDTGYGFDNIGDVLSLSPTLLERYVQASGRVLDAAIVTKIPHPVIKSYRGGQFTPRNGGPSPSGSMSSNGTLGVKFSVPADGEYKIEVRAGGSPAKNEWPIMRIQTEKGPRKDVRVDKPRGELAFDLKAKWKKGDGRWIDISFLNDHYDPGAEDPRQRDRNLYLEEIRVTGPLKRKLPPPTEAHKAIFAAGDKDAPEPERARQVVTRFVERAWRRPVEDSEIDRLMGIYEKVRGEKENFEEGVKLALQASLVSPNFLYRGEIRNRPDAADVVEDIDEFDLASRLSYFLWSSMPDDELFQLARENRLRENLDAQVTRMLNDEKAEALTKNFAGQWLQLRNLQIASPDPKTYRSWNDSLRRAMREETERFFASVVKENRPVLDFLDADYTFVNEQLANHYGISGVKGSKFQRVNLTGDLQRQRGGVLTHASILTITSNPTRTSAVNRGNFVLENLLGTPPPPAPEDVEIPPLEASGKGDNKGKTLRQQLELHRAKPLCNSCHKRMDPIGFGMENFDGIGRWREEEFGKPINSSGELYTGEPFDGPAELRKILAKEKGEAFLRCLIEKLMTYGLGRGLEYYDKPALTEVAHRTEEGEYRFHELINAIVHSVPFQKCRGDGTKPE